MSRKLFKGLGFRASGFRGYMVEGAGIKAFVVQVWRFSLKCHERFLALPVLKLPPWV